LGFAVVEEFEKKDPRSPFLWLLFDRRRRPKNPLPLPLPLMLCSSEPPLRLRSSVPA
jgi:hypothetical protein